MTSNELSAMIQAVTLLIVAISGALTAYTHYKVSQLPTKEDTKEVATELAATNGHLEEAVKKLNAKL